MLLTIALWISKGEFAPQYRNRIGVISLDVAFCRYIDALLRRRGSKGRGWTIGAQAPPRPNPPGKRGGAALADEISGLVAGSAPAPESDEEEEKDHYFSDASDDADGLEA